MSNEKGWDAGFFVPIPVSKGEPLVTLRDAANHIIALPRKDQEAPAWQTAMRALILCADHGQGVDPYLAELGMKRALHPRGERVFKTGAKETHWGRRKLKRDQ